MADAADLSIRSSVEEPQTYIGHHCPSAEDVADVCRDATRREDRTFNPDARRSPVRRINHLHRHRSQGLDSLTNRRVNKAKLHHLLLVRDARVAGIALFAAHR